MQVVNRFREYYVEPIIQLSKTFTIVMEVVKIIAAKVFLEYLGQCFLNYPKIISKSDVYDATVTAPVFEEIFFRFFVLKGIHVAQMALKDEKKDPSEEVGFWSKFHSLVPIRLHSTIYGDMSPRDEEDNAFVIIMYPPLVEEVLLRIYMRLIDPVGLFKTDEQRGFTEEEAEERRQQMFRIHTATLIFAAAHLGNPHTNKTSALVQFTWTFIGGIIYGYLSEKYHSLAPGILAHGFNNSIATSAAIYHNFTPFLLVALVVNRVAFYVLAKT